MREKAVYYISITISILLAIISIAFKESFAEVSNYLFAVISENCSWMYLLCMLVFVVFVIGIAFSKCGNIKLGMDDDKPEYSTFSWFAMLFCAGMGVGLVFWGISEPLSHYISPEAGIAALSPEAAEFAFKSSFMHWGIHPWANYAVIGLALAYFQFRRKKPGLISSTLTPLIGEKSVSGWAGKVVDILASFATVAGIVTSLGLGVLQITSGINKLFGIPDSLTIQIAIIVIVTAIFLTSSISGINKGVKSLSNFNVILSLVFMAGAVIVGPRLEIFNNLVNGLGAYINDFFKDSLSISEYGDTSWVKAWRVFYWAWWIAWAPFVGVFIARISKGRTVREFVSGVVLAPTLASVVWFAIFGTMGIHLGANGILSNEALVEVVSAPETGLFTVMENYSLGGILSVIAIVLLLVFFVTSADSGTFVLAMMSSNGELNPKNGKKVVWAIVQALLAIGLLLVGGLKPLQTLSIVAAFPFMFIMLVICGALIKAFREEMNIETHRQIDKKE